MDLTAYILIALLKTPGEGGTVQVPYPTSEACVTAGARLEEQFEGIAITRDDGVVVHPRVLWTCLAPVGG